MLLVAVCIGVGLFVFSDSQKVIVKTEIKPFLSEPKRLNTELWAELLGKQILAQALCELSKQTKLSRAEMLPEDV